MISVVVSGDDTPLSWLQAVAKDGRVIVCTVSQPYLEFLNNWLISLAKHSHHHTALVIAEDYATLDFVNDRWPGHAVLVPPAPKSTPSLRFGSQVSRYVGLRAGLVCLLPQRVTSPYWYVVF